jgi:hypothetical protein
MRRLEVWTRVVSQEIVRKEKRKWINGALPIRTAAVKPLLSPTQSVREIRPHIQLTRPVWGPSAFRGGQKSPKARRFENRGKCSLGGKERKPSHLNLEKVNENEKGE